MRAMLPILTRAQIRAYDAHAIAQCAVPGVILMENAGRGAAALLQARYQSLVAAGARGPVAIVRVGNTSGPVLGPTSPSGPPLAWPPGPKSLRPALAAASGPLAAATPRDSGPLRDSKCFH